jgi:hypothetical protein
MQRSGTGRTVDAPDPPPLETTGGLKKIRPGALPPGPFQSLVGNLGKFREQTRFATKITTFERRCVAWNERGVSTQKNRLSHVST